MKSNYRGFRIWIVNMGLFQPQNHYTKHSLCSINILSLPILWTLPWDPEEWLLYLVLVISASFSLRNWVPLDYKQLNRTPQVTGNNSSHCSPRNTLRHNNETPDCRVQETGDATATHVTLTFVCNLIDKLAGLQ